MLRVLLLYFLFSPLIGLGQSWPPIIPLPSEFNKAEGEFSLGTRSFISYADPSLADEAHYLQKELLKQSNLPLSMSSEALPHGIRLEINSGVGNTYQLSIAEKGVRISSGTEEGVFYGVISLIQLIKAAEKREEQYLLPAWEIRDQAAYPWRGLMLDESRYFFGVQKVKQILDWMAFYKLNRFHWHLTDAPGWRIEIKKHPMLTLVGGIGNHGNPHTPAQYYTQEEIKDIVSYARERKIEVIPEIDMPGHASAANRAYPEFSGGGSEKYPEFTFHPAKEATYQYLTDILKEVNALFPAQMIHLGGDEVSFGNEKWNTDPEVKALMDRQNLSNLKDVENYFFQRMADTLIQMNNKVLAWDEMANASMDPEKTLLFWWRQDRPAQLVTALKNGYPTVICPRIPFYFDFVQMDSHRFGRKWAGAFSSLESVYGFSLQSLPIQGDQAHLIQGIQANIWTETVHNEERLDFLLFPRIAALAETSWTAEPQKDYIGFLSRLKKHLPFYQKDHIYYFDPFDPEYHPEPVYPSH